MTRTRVVGAASASSARTAELASVSRLFSSIFGLLNGKKVGDDPGERVAGPDDRASQLEAVEVGNDQQGDLDRPVVADDRPVDDQVDVAAGGADGQQRLVEPDRERRRGGRVVRGREVSHRPSPFRSSSLYIPTGK